MSITRKNNSQQPILNLKVSIIIPVKKINQYLLENVSHLEKLNWKNYETLIVTDHQVKKYTWPKTRIIVSGPAGPAQKRDLGAKYAKGQIIAFLDDDAYPAPDWLNHAVKHFENEQISAVGGPGLTPPNADFWEKASGWVSASPLGSGPYTYWFISGKKQFVEDFPSMNLLVRKTDFDQVGGFDSKYYPGEDTKLCLDLINLGQQIVYEPKAVVYHHRRALWLSHLKQHGNFGLHRGFFARKLPKTSAKIVYFLPSGLVLAVLVCASGGLGWPTLLTLSHISLLVYGLLLVANSIWVGLTSNSPALAVVTLPAVFLNHFWYGVKFIQGFLMYEKLYSQKT